MRITRFEQSAIIINSDAGTVLAVDLGSEVPVEVPAKCRASAALVSHQHPDHLHRPHLAALRAPVYAPNDVVHQLAQVGLELHAVAAGDTFQIGDISVTAFDSDHGPNLSSPIQNLGFAFSSGSVRVLFLGDMAVPSSVPNGPWNLVLVPVGGSKVFNPIEAASFIRHIGHSGLTMPIHYHGRADRTTGDQFKRAASSFCDVRVLGVGEDVTS